MYSKRVFALMSLMVVFAMVMTACGTAAKAPETGKELTVAGVVFQDDQFMKAQSPRDLTTVIAPAATASA